MDSISSLSHTLFHSPHFALLVSAICIFLAAFSYLGYRIRLLSPANNDSGPTNYPFIGCVIAFYKNRNRVHDWVADFIKKAPTLTIRIVRFGTAVYVTANPKNVEYILKTRFGNYPKSRKFQVLMDDLLGEGIFNVNGELWSFQRKLASYEFTTKSLRTFTLESVQQEIVLRLLPILNAANDNGAVIDLQDLLMRFGFDNICKVAAGIDPGCLNPSLSNSEFCTAFDLATELSLKRFLGIIPYLWKIKRALKIGSEDRLRQSLKVVNDFAMHAIRTRREQLATESCVNSSQRKDLLCRFMGLPGGLEMGKEETTMKDVEDRKVKSPLFSDKLLRDMIISFLLAGRDTSSSALTWFFWLLTKNPRVEDSIRAEIQQILDARKSNCEEKTVAREYTIPSNENNSTKGNTEVLFSYDELRNMDYLQAALSETLRLYPPVPQDSREASKKDVLPDGTVLKSGTQISYHPYAMGRIQSLWGEDCLEFRPERWLNSAGKFCNQNPFKFPVFQAGPRTCLGREMAFITMKSVAAAVIRLYTFKLASSVGFTPAYTMSITLHMENGLPVTAHRRSLN